MVLLFGFAVKVLGATSSAGFVDPALALPSNDARRWQNSPHVRQSIVYARAIFEYLHASDIHMYRMSSDFVPYVTHPDMPQFHRQLDEAAEELESLGALAREYKIRLSLHPSQYILLNALDDVTAAKSINDLNAQADLLDSLGCDSNAVVVTHVGGVYGDREASKERFVRRYAKLPESTRRRLVVENDDVSFGIDDVLWIHEQTGCPVVFDNLHHYCNNPARIPMKDAFQAALATWAENRTPKMHYSSPSTTMEMSEMRVATNTKSKDVVKQLKVPANRAHADFISPLEFIQFWQIVEGRKVRNFDVMLEAKAKDIALKALRKSLERQTEVPFDL